MYLICGTTFGAVLGLKMCVRAIFIRQYTDTEKIRGQIT